MSSIVVSGDTSGTITISAPAVSGTNTLTLPASTGTLALTGAAVTRSQMPAGTILQVVQATLNGQFTSTSTSFVNSGLTASITPSSSSNKILVQIVLQGCFQAANLVSFGSTIYRNSTNLSPNGSLVVKAFGEMNIAAGGSGALVTTIPMNYLDSPSTTSSTAYTAYVAAGSAGTIGVNQDGGVSTIILMEVAA